MFNGKDKFNCRFYRNKYPVVDETIIVKVNEITKMGAYVSLLEYNNKEGMLLLSELSRRRIRSISRFIRVGKIECVVVLRVNEEKGFIDLSKKLVHEEEEIKCKIRYAKGKSVNNIFIHVCKVCEDVTVKQLYKCIGWKLNDKYGNAYDALKHLANDKMEVIKDIEFPSMKVREEFLKIVKKRLKPQDVKVRADLDVTCYSYGGILSIKKALIAGKVVEIKDEETDELKKVDVSITLLAPPRYVLTYVGKMKIEGLRILEKSILQISQVIKAENGKMVVKMPPTAISKEEEKQHELILKSLEEQTKEVSGDDDGDEFL